jgi:hypothetical protein
MKKRILLLVALGSLAGLAAFAWFWNGVAGYHRYMSSLLARGLARVDFEPGWDYEQI